MSALLSIALSFIKAVEDGQTGDQLDIFYHPDIEQKEYPNALVKNLVVRNLNDLKEASIKGSQILVKQRYDIQSTHVTETTVIIEAIWTGTLVIPLGKIPAGGDMKANFAQFFEFQDGKIIKQRNYDCFEPFM